MAEALQTSWERVFRSVEMAVTWGLAHRDLEGVRSIGIDEVLWHRGYKFLTVVYQIDAGVRRLLWVGQDRKAKTLLRFFRWFGPERSARLHFICTDMWRPYLKVIERKASGAIQVLDRFHIMAHLSKAIDEVRAKEAAREPADSGPDYEPDSDDDEVLELLANLPEREGRDCVDVDRARPANAYAEGRVHPPFPH